MEQDKTAGIVRPFGAFGPRYEVGAVGLWANRAGYLLLFIAITASLFWDSLGLAREMRHWMFAAALLTATVLTLIVTLNGRKL